MYSLKHGHALFAPAEPANSGRQTSLSGGDNPGFTEEALLADDPYHLVIVAAERIVFVTTELYPETQGGAGVVVDALARHLAISRPVLILLASPDPVEVMERRGIEVEVGLISPSGFMERSRETAQALAATVQPGDRIEVQDFEGLGYSLLLDRARFGLDQIPITVRFHGPYDLLREAMETDPGDWGLPAAMERGVFRMADQVLIPVEGHRDTLIDRFGVESDRVVVSPPPIPPLEGGVSGGTGTPVFAALGRLGEMKGSQDLVRAALSLLDDGVDIKVRFIGSEGWSPTGQAPMTEWLIDLIPEHHRPAFEFPGPRAREHISDLLEDVTAVVVASRFESFCLAAHEARRLGLPVVIPDLPAFRGLFDDATGALVYDSSVAGLTTSLRRLATEGGLAADLGERPVPQPGDTWAAYRSEPKPRHPRSQAGLATEAAQHVEQSTPPPLARSSPALRRVYRYLPGPVARVAARLAPEGVKDRLRQHAYWPEEQERKARDNRLREIERRIAAGEFPELETPDVTVVIPAYDDVDYLEEALASVYEQTHSSWEIIVVDDGSSQPEVVSFLDTLDRPRLRLHRQENMGLPAARNAGMKLARGEFLIPLDSDDELAPEYMSKLLDELREDPKAGFAHCLARLHGDIDAVWIPRPYNPYWQLFENSVVGCVVMRAAAWESVGGYDETMTSGNEDWEMWLRLTGAGWSQVRVEEPLFWYRKHGVSMSVSTESRFEQGRRMVRDRNLAMYEKEAMKATRLEWYPLLTIIGGSNPLPESAELVADPEELSGTWGKYVIDIRGVEDRISWSTLLEMADTLEANAQAAIARTSGEPPLVMIRRWSLHDPEAEPAGELVLDDMSTGPDGAPTPGSLPRAGWVVPSGLRVLGVPVQRQRPEETAAHPDPSRW
jgi:GT2 family glycosyltransferase/glycosyltransferase involved in cell wall biosynthesis